jgi:hypothetical protein
MLGERRLEWVIHFPLKYVAKIDIPLSAKINKYTNRDRDRDRVHDSEG